MSRIDTSIHDFTNAAQEALKTGRYIKPDNEGGVRLTSGSLRGRIVNWVKNHAFPDRRRSEQVQVLKRFVALVNKEYPHAAKDKVHMALYNTGGLPFARRVLNAARYTSMANEGCEHKADQTAQLAEDVQEAVRLGYISKVTGKGGKQAMSEEEFKYAVREYNKTMTDLRKRFPRLVNVRPIVLSRKKLKE